MTHLQIISNIKTLREELCMTTNSAEITWLMIMFIWLCLHYVLADKLHIYRVTHFNRRTWISRNLSQIEKNGSDKSYRGQRGLHSGANVFDLELDL